MADEAKAKADDLRRLLETCKKGTDQYVELTRQLGCAEYNRAQALLELNAINTASYA
jgi:hypothetical protein